MSQSLSLDALRHRTSKDQPDRDSLDGDHHPTAVAQRSGHGNGSQSQSQRSVTTYTTGVPPTIITAPPSKFTNALIYLLLFLVLGVYLLYFSLFINEFASWNDLDCDSNSYDSALVAIQTQAGNGNKTAPELHQMVMDSFVRRTSMAKVYLYFTLLIHFFGISGALLFAYRINDNNSHLLSSLGVFLDCSTIGVFIWGVWLYISSAVCSFYFFKLTLIYCILQIFLLIFFVNSVANRKRTAKRIDNDRVIAETNAQTTASAANDPNMLMGEDEFDHDGHMDDRSQRSAYSNNRSHRSQQGGGGASVNNVSQRSHHSVHHSSRHAPTIAEEPAQR